MILKRILSKKLVQLLTKNEEQANVLLVEGPRQVGKTTLVLECLKEHSLPHLALNLERDLRHKASIDHSQSFTEFTQWLEDEFRFKPNGSRILFIDEAQESQRLGGYVRFMKEEWPRTKVILTGSMMHRLFRDETRYPVGRVATLRVQPFSFFEYLWAKGKADWVSQMQAGLFHEILPSRHEALLRELDSYFHLGGLPPVLLSSLEKTQPQHVIREIFENYRNDFMRVFGEGEGFLFEKAMQAVADHVGSPSTLTQALPNNDPAYRKIAGVYSRLEAWHMIYTCHQRSAQPEGTTLFHPKRYLFDMGLLSQLRTLGVPSLDILGTKNPLHRQTLGGIVENLVAFYLEHWNVKLTTWKKSTAGAELDFILQDANKTVPIECKATLKTKEPHLRALKIYMSEFELRTGVLVNLAPYAKRNYSCGTILSVPLYAFEALPEILAHETNKAV